MQARYIAAVGGIGYVWRDLKASTSYSGGGNENVVLQFLVGLGCHLLANVGTTCTAVDSAPFDIFAAPNPPVNLKVEPYGPLGFRLEMTPGAITRMRPLSGYMIEVRSKGQFFVCGASFLPSHGHTFAVQNPAPGTLRSPGRHVCAPARKNSQAPGAGVLTFGDLQVDTCTQSATTFELDASAACATHTHSYPESDDLYAELGGDFTTGGGATEVGFDRPPAHSCIRGQRLPYDGRVWI